MEAFEEKPIVEKDIRKQIEKLEQVIIVKNSYSTKVKNGFESMKTPQGAAAAVLVLGTIGYIGYSVFKSNK